MMRSLVPMVAVFSILISSHRGLARRLKLQADRFPVFRRAHSVPVCRTRDTAQRPQTGTAKIRGRVMAAVGSTPLRRTQISLTATDNPQLRRSTTTDGDGRYELVDLPAGRYQMTVTKAGYVTMQYGQRRPFEPGTPISVRDGETVSSIDFALPKGAVITVRLTDEFGEPVAGQTGSAAAFPVGRGRSASPDGCWRCRRRALLRDG